MHKYVFKPYNDIFPALFESEKKRLTPYLVQFEYQIEHGGSTAIPGLGGKGIVDIYIVSAHENLEAISQAMEKAGYMPQKRIADDSHIFHCIELPDPVDGVRRYHIHINTSDAPDYVNAMHFRDYLRNNPSEAKKYADIKIKAAEEANDDKETYMAIKAPVILEILQLANTKNR